MICSCGARYPDSDEFCIYCGARNPQYQPPDPNEHLSSGALDPGQPLYPGQPPYPGQTPTYGQTPYPEQQPSYGQQPYQDQYSNSPQANGAATGSLVCGIIGFFVAGLILGLVAITQSKKAKRLGYVGGKATAGMVLGVIDVIAWAILVVLMLIAS